MQNKFFTLHVNMYIAENEEVQNAIQPDGGERLLGVGLHFCPYHQRKSQNTILVFHKNLLLRVSFIYGITFQFTLCNHLAQNFLIFRIGTVHLQRFQPHVFFFLIRKAVPLLLRKFLITYIRYDIWISQPPGTVLIQFRKSKKVVFLDRAVHIHFFFRPARFGVCLPIQTIDRIQWLLR